MGLLKYLSVLNSACGKHFFPSVVGVLEVVDVVGHLLLVRWNGAARAQILPTQTSLFCGHNAVLLSRRKRVAFIILVLVLVLGSTTKGHLLNN